MREPLAAYLRETADWRDRKAEEYPDDPRNVRSAAALRALAEYVSHLPDDHEVLVALAAAERCLYIDGRISPGEEASRVASRFGFYETWNGDLVLTLFADAVRREATDYRRDQSRWIVKELYDAAKASSATDWLALEEYLTTGEDAEHYAEALAAWWEKEGDEPGFNQPAGSLVRQVEELVGGPVEF